MNLDLLHAELLRDEVLRLKPYVDTVGKITIGIGYNLTDRGISLHIAEELYAESLAGVLADLDRVLPWWRGLDDVRQRALANLTFNMGIGRLLGFTTALAALKQGDYAGAADGLVASRWYRQVGVRGPRLVSMIRTGSV